MEKKIFKFNFRGRELVVEHGEVAKQAHGAVLVRYGDTVILSTTVVSNNANLLSDFFPLMVLYNEKLYSVGKIPGGFIKREGRPTDAATLAARMIDRPLRPLFPEDFRNEVQIVNTVLSVDQDNSPELTALFGSSLSVSISKAPFNGPVAAVKVGRVNGEFVINPTIEQTEVSDLDLTVAGTREAINMVEAGAMEVSEEDMLEALMFGHEAIKELIAFEEEIVQAIGEPKMKYEKLEISPELRSEVDEFCRDRIDASLRILDKTEKYEALDKVKEDLVNKYKELYEDKMKPDEYKELITKIMLVFSDIEYEIFRNITVLEHTRADGRKMDEIRPLSTAIDLLPRCHGSALFTRGQTQSLATVTLGALGEHQVLDGLGIEDEKRFMLHYNFPAFSVGETGRYGSPGRREIGHGALGERALSYVIPSEEEFPYTIRVVSEILESNGSSSQATICSGCMALMAAGVPIRKPVAGIAMGLITSGEEYTVLTDIQGLEDHLGDMDFKVAGTRDGITALQMDIKISGINREILKEALAQAKKARMEILDVIQKEIAEPRKEVSKYAPKTCTFMINPEKIKDVIGRGGEIITKIIQECSGVISVNDDKAVKVDLEDDGRVMIYHMDQTVIDKTRERIENIAREVEIGKIYNCRVVDIQDFGAFVEVWPGCEGLIHISQLDINRVNKTSDVVKVGDEVLAIATGYDKKGKLNLSRKEVLLRNRTKREEHHVENTDKVEVKEENN